MARNYIGVIKLAPHIRAWADPKNKIHLVNNGRYFKCILDDYDLEPIMKGLKEGLIVETTAFAEGTADADDGARLPRYCGYNICQLHLIKEAVAADYLEDVDFKSSLEWQPPQPVEGPAPKPGNANVEIEVEASEVEMNKPLMIQVGVDEIKPEKVMQQVGTGEFDEEGNEIMEEVEVEQHREVTINIEAAEGSVSPASVTFSSDPAADNYYGNGPVEVQFMAPEVTADKQIAINFSGDGVNAKSQNVKVKYAEAPQVVNPVVLINGQKDVIELGRGITSFEAAITIDHGDCSADQLTLADITMELVNVADVNSGYAGTDGEITVLDNTTISGICQPKSGAECVAAEIRICGVCGDGSHVIDQVIQIKVPAMKMFWGQVSMVDVVIGDPLIFNYDPNFFNDKMTTEVGPQPYQDLDGDPDAGTFFGAWMLIQPAGSGLTFKCYDITGGAIDIGTTTLMVAGVDYEVQYADLISGKGGIKVEAV